MAQVRWANYVRKTFAQDATAAATTIYPSSTTGWPSLPNSGDYFYLTLLRTSDNSKEIVKVTSYTGTTATVTRAQEGTTALTFSAGDRMEGWLTAGLLTDIVAELRTGANGFQNYVNQTINYGALTIPGSALQDSLIALRHIPDGLITGVKLNAAVAGLGLTQNASGNLDINTSATIDISADAPIVKAGSLTGAQVSGGFFFNQTGGLLSTSTGVGVFYQGTPIPGAPIFGNAGSNGRIVMATIGNDHLTQDAVVSIRIGNTLSFYNGTGADTGARIAHEVRLQDATFWGGAANIYKQFFSFPIGPGMRWMFVNETPGTGTLNLYTHHYFDLL